MNAGLSRFIMLITGASAFICSCRKDAVISPGSIQVPKASQLPADTSLSDTSHYVDVTVDGKRTFYISGRNGCDMYYGGSGQMNFSGITSDSNINPLIGAYYNTSFLEFDRYDFPDHSNPPSSYNVADFNNWALANYATGNYNYYSPLEQLSLANGIALVWTDASGTQWKTGAGPQPGSGFTIIKEDSVSNSPGGYITGIHVTAQFTCTLYDPGGNAHSLTNGRFRLLIWL